MDVFRACASDLKETQADLRGRLETARSYTGQQKFAELTDIKAELKEAEDTLRTMKLSAQNLPSVQQQKAMATVEKFEGQIRDLRSDIERAESSFTFASEREELFSTASRDVEVTSLDQRTRMLRANETLDRGSQHILNAQMATEDAIATGGEVLVNLHQQREQIQRGRARLRGVQDQITRAGTIMRGMYRRLMTNKLILAVVVVVLVGLIGFIVYAKWFA